MKELLNAIFLEAWYTSWHDRGCPPSPRYEWFKGVALCLEYQWEYRYLVGLK